MTLAQWLIERVERWAADSARQMIVVRSRTDLERCLAAGGPLGILLGVQGGHVLEGDAGNVAVLRELGVRMFAPAHVMDNDLVGSGTGKSAAGLSGFGREVVAELEAQDVIVDLAHMSIAGVEETMPLLTRPFLLSHGALRDSDHPGRPGHFRRYNAETRNVPASVAAAIAAHDGLFGVVLATQLLGGSTLKDGANMIRRVLAACGERNVALGSDMDGALKMLIATEGLPALAEALLIDGLSPDVVSGFLRGNAMRFLRSALPA
jgi:microsomal dipeptidase-like Zn-dependent dipeptidase